MVLSISPGQIRLTPGSEVTLTDQAWEDYEAPLASRCDDYEDRPESPTFSKAEA